jgi:hypothetical protein
LGGISFLRRRNPVQWQKYRTWLTLP